MKKLVSLQHAANRGARLLSASVPVVGEYTILIFDGDEFVALVAGLEEYDGYPYIKQETSITEVRSEIGSCMVSLELCTQEEYNGMLEEARAERREFQERIDRAHYERLKSRFEPGNS